MDYSAPDFTADNARLAEIEVIVANTRSALAQAAARREEIANLLRPYRLQGGVAEPLLEDGAAVAEALLAGSTATEAAALAGASRDELERERETLRLAMRDLAERERTAEAERQEVRRRVQSATLDRLRPLVEVLGSAAVTAMQTLYETSAALEAIGRVTRSRPRQFDQVADAVDALRGVQRSIIPRGTTVAVDPDILALLARIAAASPALNPPPGSITT